jgi:hypothetical protein
MARHTLTQQHVDESFVSIVARLGDLHRVAERVLALAER